MNIAHCLGMANIKALCKKNLSIDKGDKERTRKVNRQTDRWTDRRSMPRHKTADPNQ